MNGVINQILCIIFLTIPNVFEALALEQMLEVDETKSKRWFRLFCWILLYGSCVVYKVILNDPKEGQIFKWFIMFASSAIALGYFYKDPIWRKFVAYVSLVLGICLGEVGLLVIVPFIEIESMMMWDHTQIEMVFAIMIGTIFSSLGIFLVATVWKRVFHKGKTMKYTWFFAIFYLATQLTCFLLMSYTVMDTVLTYRLFYRLVVSFAISLLCNIFILIVIFNQSEKESMRVELAEAKKKAELEQIHYQKTKVRREELTKITEKNNQIIKKVAGLIAEKRIEEAKSVLMDLQYKVEKTREYPFCNIPIVNVILSEKQKECEKYNIEMQVDIRLPEKTEIKQIDFCSIFSNLMDNAIRAGKQMSGNAVINLKAAMNGEYLIIKCTNPALKEPGKTPEGTGYGLKILKDIAACYEGDFRTGYQEHEFTAQMSVRFR